MIYSRSPGWQSPQEQKNVSPAPYPWRKLYSCKNKTFLGPTFPFPWSSGLSSLAALGRQLSCRSWKVKSCPSESLVPPQFHSFISNPMRIYILCFFYLVNVSINYTWHRTAKHLLLREEVSLLKERGVQLCCHCLHSQSVVDFKSTKKSLILVDCY